MARKIAIVGSGFCGTALSINLLRQLAGSAAQILLIDDREEPGAGIAYARHEYPYPLNVPAGQMSVDPHRPRDFVEFVRSLGMDAADTDYLPRTTYGAYLRARLREAATAAGPETRLVPVRCRAARVFRSGEAPGWQVALQDGRRISADEVVLALGNPPPMRFAGLRAIEGTSQYVHEPWEEESSVEGVDRVLLIGTGLTMTDHALRLAAALGIPEIHVLSRHGLLPARQSNFSRTDPPADAAARIANARGSARRLLREVRDLCETADASGGDWRQIITLVRVKAPEIWGRMRESERRRFMRHVRPYWEVHRHRAPETTLDRLTDLHRSGVLRLHAGRIEAARLVEGRIDVTWRPRHATRRETLRVDRIINCTGPDHCIARHPDPLVASLIRDGLISADPLSLGIRTTAGYEPIGKDGLATPGLYYLGPWMRATEWEATAVPELRRHAQRLAAILLRANDSL